MSFSSKQTLITLADVLAKTSEEGVLAKYLSITKLPCAINSPLRQDSKPSFGIYYDGNNKIKWKDFATGECGNLWSLLSKMWGIPFDKVLLRVYNDSIENNKITCNKLHKSAKKHTQSVIQCKIREWKQHDLDYWETYGISKKWLMFGEVYPISHIFFTKNGVTYTFPADKYAYVYIERKDNKATLKIYQPLVKDKSKKWYNSNNSSVWDLWTKLPKTGDKLIITSSRKDALSIWENTGIPSVSMQAESVLPKPQVIQELKDRFSKVYILYDNDFTNPDNPGRNLGKRLSEMYNLIQIEIPDKYKSKDSSDLVKNHGRNTLKEVILNLVK